MPASSTTTRDKNPVITAAVRLPIGRRAGSLSEFDGVALGAKAIESLVSRANLSSSQITDVIMGNTLSHYGNPARVAALASGLDESVAAMTIDRQCGSGINSAALAGSLAVANGGLYVAGGMESMTNEPFQLARSARAFDAQPPKFLRRELSTPEVGDPTMGQTAENLANKYNISREEQDHFAAISQQRYADAHSQGKYNTFIVPVTLPHGEVLEDDEHPRPSTTEEKLAKLRPVFAEDGTVTAGNASGINDGAAALAITDSQTAQELALPTLAEIGHSTVVGVDPKIMGIGPVNAIQKLLAMTNGSLNDYEFIEINEAFAVQVLACTKELGLDLGKVNPLGGAIAHGHPIAATGTILIQKVISELTHRGGGKAIVTACIGGGQGIATEIIVKGS